MVTRSVLLTGATGYISKKMRSVDVTTTVVGVVWPF